MADDQGTPTRLYAVDASRAFLLLLGIPFHAAIYMFYVRNASVPKIEASAVIQVAMTAIHAFRMFAFFMMSGYFSALIVQKRGRQAWFEDRLARLGIPLAASLLSLSIVQFFVMQYFGMQTTGVFGLPIEVDHLWFLFSLLCYVSLYNLLVKSNLETMIGRHLDVSTRRGLFTVLSLLSGWGLLQAGFDFLVRRTGEHSVLPIVSQTVLFLPAFLIGAAAVSGRLREKLFSSGNISYFGLAGLSLTILIAVSDICRPVLGLPATPGFSEKIAINIIQLPAAYFISVAVFDIFSRIITRRFAIVE